MSKPVADQLPINITNKKLPLKQQSMNN